ncbi:trypco2 family protein [Antrihabitans stalactiti]|uniref:Trypsin-co-occurring domain-containing protein n=1 Tax=Antrihabitans stalactiti TaxID=2584121 RepID=A0A848KEZ8_9NOCA|nr:trypco2 family protein [Antrihabitans stalactiti]NMN96879.1 hypothetical protein [Antrihabitans stalactiti]
MADGEWVELTEALAVLKRQLVDAETTRPDEHGTFELGRVEVEFCVELRNHRPGDEKLEFGVVAGAEAEHDSGVEHRIKLVLNPKDFERPLKGARHRRS